MALNILSRQCLCAVRNLGQKEKGCLQEIGFEEFVTVLAFFRPPKPHIAEEEKKNMKKEKLRCENNEIKTLSIAVIDLNKLIY